MIINQHLLLQAAPIRDMVNYKVAGFPTSWGLTECGYDIRIAEEVIFEPGFDGQPDMSWACDTHSGIGRLALASSIELFQMPNHLMGRVLNKSTWARQGLDASMTTNIEPGWRGHLTIELIYHGTKQLHIPAGAGICQVIFESIAVSAQYQGKYQDQPSGAQGAITHG